MSVFLSNIPMESSTEFLRSLLSWTLTALYLAALLIASIYGLHRYWLVVRYYRRRDRRPVPPGQFDELPHVTVQLPMFHERYVAERIIDAACRLDYPREKLQIQVLDDSTDGSEAIAQACAERWRARGIDIEYRHRTDRTGYKAGALQAGLESATGQFIAVFDADFVPSPDYLRQVIDHFIDPAVGMVQAAWAHINCDDSILTRCQAIYLDSHFQIEHSARHRYDHWFNFNGTAGTWRRETIESAGGWQHDTLTEDMDLSYRAQLAGWQFIYRQDVDCPAELPPEIVAFKTQQHRWTKGTVQTAIKLLRPILRSNASRGQRMEAAFHLTSPIVYPCVILIAVLMLPAVLINLRPFEHGTISAGLFGLMILLLATASGVTFYVAGQIERGAGLLRTLSRVPALIALGVGMSVNNTLAVTEAMLGRQSAFVRTPKYNRSNVVDTAPRQSRPAGHRDSRPAKARWVDRGTISIAIELTIGIYLLICLGFALTSSAAFWTVPFLAMFAAGYLSVGIGSIQRSAWMRWFWFGKAAASPSPSHTPDARSQKRTVRQASGAQPDAAPQRAHGVRIHEEFPVTQLNGRAREESRLSES